MNRRYRRDESSIDILANKYWTKYNYMYVYIMRTTTLFLKKNTLPTNSNTLNSLIIKI